MSVQQINLLNPGLLAPKVRFSCRTIVVLLLVVVGLGLLGTLWVFIESRDIRARMTQVQSERDEIQSRIDAQAQPGEDGQTGEDKHAQALASVKRRIAHLRQIETALGAAHGEAGFSPRLRALANEGFPGVWLTGIEFDQTGFRLEGRALQAARIPDYLALLARQPALDRLALSGFRIEMPEPAGNEPAPGVAFVVNPAGGTQP